MADTKPNIKRCLICQSLLTSSGECRICGSVNTIQSAVIAGLDQNKVANKKNKAKKRENNKNQDSDIKAGFKSASELINIPADSKGFLFNKITKERFELSRTVSKIGRDSSNNISISADRHVSRYHAWILHNKGKFWVEDLSSTNGTLLNGQPVTVRMPLAAGDRIVFGKTELIFVVD